MIDKKSLRKIYLDKRNEYLYKKEDSAIICHKLREALKSYSKIALYFPIRGEVDIWPLVEELSVNKEIYLPVTLDKLYFRKFSSSFGLEVGKMGIMEPNGDKLIGIEDLEAVVIPSIAINKKGYRLGFGKGYYDVAMNDFLGVKIGIIYSFQLIDVDFHEPHDIKFDLIIMNER